MKKSILIIDDHSVVRQGLAMLIKNNVSNSELYCAENISTAINILKSKKIDFIILDINLPDGGGMYVINEIKLINNSAKILIFSALEEGIYALRYIQAGADGYLNKMVSDQDMVIALIRFVQTGKYFSDNIKDIIFENFITKKDSNPINGLADREIEIARLLIKGFGNLEIALKMNLKKSTVSTYKNRVFEKLNVNNLSSLIELFRLYDEQV